MRLETAPACNHIGQGQQPSCRDRTSSAATDCERARTFFCIDIHSSVRLNGCDSTAACRTQRTNLHSCLLGACWFRPPRASFFEKIREFFLKFFEKNSHGEVGTNELLSIIGCFTVFLLSFLLMQDAQGPEGSSLSVAAINDETDFWYAYIITLHWVHNWLCSWLQS